MPTFTFMTAGSKAAGTRQFGPVNVPLGYTTLTVSLSRSNWPNTGSEVIKATLELSLDGGETYPYSWSCGAMGGLPNTNSTLSFVLPEPDNANRVARATVTNTVALSVGGTITWQ